jgi:anti-sigma B factor antagonist
MVEGITVKVEKRADVAVLKCKGYIDSVTSPEVENALGELVAKRNFKIVVDLADVDYVSSAGWGIFVGYVKTARQSKGDIKFSHMKKEVLEIFELLDFTNILEYHKNTEDAVKAFVSKN